MRKIKPQSGAILFRTNKSKLYIGSWAGREDSQFPWLAGQTESYSVQPLLPLAATIGPQAIENLLLWSPALILDGIHDGIQLLSCPTVTVSYSTIYPNSCDLGTAHAILAFDQLRAQAGLWPNQILQCAASLASGGYNWPCGQIKSLFYRVPPTPLMVRPDYTTPELSYI